MRVNTVDLATAYSLESFTTPAAISTQVDRVLLMSVFGARAYEIHTAPPETSWARSGTSRFGTSAPPIDRFKHREANGSREFDEPHVLSKRLLTTLCHE